MEHNDFVDALNKYGISFRSTILENQPKVYACSGVGEPINIAVKNNKCEFVDYVTFTKSEPLPMLIAKQIDRGSWKHSWHNNVYDAANYPKFIDIMQKTMLDFAKSMEEMLTVYFALKSEVERIEEIKDSANFNINQQTHDILLTKE